jgi:hypothetical protein
VAERAERALDFFLSEVPEVTASAMHDSTLAD